jgi:dihydroorotate dehydrogenase electron transfer subunit
MSETISLRRADLGDRIRPAVESPRGSFVATVLGNRALCTDHYRLTLGLARFPASTPGQFVQLACRDLAAADLDEPHVIDWPPADHASAKDGRSLTVAALKVVDPDFAGPVAFLRRPFSIADQRRNADGTAELDIIHRVVGRGTTALARLRPGDQVSLLGPLGVGFQVPANLQRACLVGGGVGIPPLLYLARRLALGRTAGGGGAPSGCRRVAFLGAQRQDLLPVTVAGVPASPTGEPLPSVAELNAWDCPAVITTDDGSLGMKGLVTQALRQFLEAHPQPDTIIYCCGPTPMMKAAARVAAALAVPCQASLEQPMACGMGTCQSCIVRFRPHTEPAETEWTYKLACTDGPVFDTRDLMW